MANVCETCGDEGWVEALVFCDSCKLGAVHRYCCGITPVPIDGYVTWFCSDCDESDSASDSTQVEHRDTSNVEVSSSPEHETRDIRSTTISVSEAGDGASVLEMSENEKNKKKKKKKKKKKRKIMTHSLPDDTVVETMEVSKKQEGSENGKSDELNGSDKSGNRKKKKMKKGKGEEKKNREGSNHFSPVQETEGHELQATTTSVEPVKESKKRKSSESKESEGLNVLVGNEVSVLKKSAKKKTNEESSTHTLHHALQDVTSVEAMKESTMPKSSESRESEGLNVLAGSEVSVLEKNAKKKKKKKRNEEDSNHTSPVLKAVDCGHQDTTSLEATKVSKKQKTSVSKESDELVGSVRNEVSVLEKSGKKKKKKTTKESSNHTAPVLANDTDNVEPEKAQESSASRKPHELAGLEKNEASLSEGGNSTNVPDHSSCTTSKKRRLSSGNIKVTSENMELPAINSSCKETESNMPQTNEVMPALNNARAQPICTPVWRGSVTVNQGNICSDHGLVAHLSTLACEKVYEKAGSLRTRLSAEMFRRLEIWPPGFLKNGPPTEESIALYFFPSPDSNGEKVYYSLLDEMKKKDMGMRCVLEDAELLFFTSYQLPLHCWKFDSKEYLWGIFRRRKT